MSGASERRIANISMNEGVVEMVYMTIPDDVRNDGLIMVTHTIAIAVDDAYTELIQALEDAAIALLDDALEDFQTTPPVSAKVLAELDHLEGDSFVPEPEDEGNEDDGK